MRWQWDFHGFMSAAVHQEDILSHLSKQSTFAEWKIALQFCHMAVNMYSNINPLPAIWRQNGNYLQFTFCFDFCLHQSGLHQNTWDTISFQIGTTTQSLISTSSKQFFSSHIILIKLSAVSSTHAVITDYYISNILSYFTFHIASCKLVQSPDVSPTHVTAWSPVKCD